MSYNVFGGTLNLTQPNITLTLTVTVTVHFYFAFYNNSPIVHSTVSERCECCRPAHKFQFRRDAATENAPSPNRRSVRGRKRLPLLEARNDERDGMQWRHYVSPVAATEGVAPIFFLKKTGDLFSHHRLPVLRCHPYLFSPEKLTNFLLTTVTFMISLGCHPLECVTRIFYMTDIIVCPLFFVNLPNKYLFLLVSQPWRVSPGAIRPPPPASETNDGLSATGVSRLQM